jgi:phosphinothricin acetyltransferase
VYVDEDHRWKGVARERYESLSAVCQVQGFHSAYAGTTIPNPASVAFHEERGFEPIGT